LTRTKQFAKQRLVDGYPFNIPLLFIISWKKNEIVCYSLERVRYPKSPATKTRITWFGQKADISVYQLFGTPDKKSQAVFIM
jgi:hypothetical protein